MTYLINIRKWAYQWKTIFNSDLTKQAQEEIFNRNLSKSVYPYRTFNNSHVNPTQSQKYLGFILDDKLHFNKHLKGTLDKLSKTIGFIRKL